MATWLSQQCSDKKSSILFHCRLSCYKRPHARNNIKKTHKNIFIVVVYSLRLQFFLIQVLVYSHTCQANLLQTKMVNVALLTFNIFIFGRFVVLFLWYIRPHSTHSTKLQKRRINVQCRLHEVIKIIAEEKKWRKQIYLKLVISTELITRDFSV